MGEGIERLRVASNQPCNDPRVYNPASNEQIYFAEMSRLHRDQPCAANKRYKKIDSDDDGLSQWDVHLENGVLTRLDEAISSTYSFWPSSESKKQVKMNIYELPIDNLKPSCFHAIDDFRWRVKDAKSTTLTDIAIP